MGGKSSLAPCVFSGESYVIRIRITMKTRVVIMKIVTVSPKISFDTDIMIINVNIDFIRLIVFIIKKICFP